MLRKLVLIAALAAACVGWGDEATACAGARACRTPCYTTCWYPCPPRCYCSVYWWNPWLCRWQSDYCIYTPYQAQWRVWELQRCGFYAYYCCYQWC
jgi:hypothetical protein